MWDVLWRNLWYFCMFLWLLLCYQFELIDCWIIFKFNLSCHYYSAFNLVLENIFFQLGNSSYSKDFYFKIKYFCYSIIFSINNWWTWLYHWQFGVWTLCQGWKDIFGFNLAAMDHIQVCIEVSAELSLTTHRHRLIQFWNDLSANDGFKIRCSFSWCKIKTARDTCSTIQTFRRKVWYWGSETEEEEDIKYRVYLDMVTHLDYVNDLSISTTVGEICVDCRKWLMKHCRFKAKLS